MEANQTGGIKEKYQDLLSFEVNRNDIKLMKLNGGLILEKEVLKSLLREACNLKYMNITCCELL